MSRFGGGGREGAKRRALALELFRQAIEQGLIAPEVARLTRGARTRAAYIFYIALQNDELIRRRQERDAERATNPDWKRKLKPRRDGSIRVEWEHQAGRAARVLRAQERRQRRLDDLTVMDAKRQERKEARRQSIEARRLRRYRDPAYRERERLRKFIGKGQWPSHKAQARAEAKAKAVQLEQERQERIRLYELRHCDPEQWLEAEYKARYGLDDANARFLRLLGQSKSEAGQRRFDPALDSPGSLQGIPDFLRRAA